MHWQSGYRLMVEWARLVVQCVVCKFRWIFGWIWVRSVNADLVTVKWNRISKEMAPVISKHVKYSPYVCERIVHLKRSRHGTLFEESDWAFAKWRNRRLLRGRPTTADALFWNDDIWMMVREVVVSTRSSSVTLSAWILLKKWVGIYLFEDN